MCGGPYAFIILSNKGIQSVSLLYYNRELTGKEGRESPARLKASLGTPGSPLFLYSCFIGLGEASTTPNMLRRQRNAVLS